VSSTNLRPTASANQRRSQRILLALPIVISGVRSNQAPFSERTSTLVVNAHGALIQLRERVLVGQNIRMKNVATNEELTCTVMDINPGTSGAPEVGVAFSESNPHFWRVSFPPTDWTPRSPEARRHTAEGGVSARIVGKK
jgi:hypothetical protein